MTLVELLDARLIVAYVGPETLTALMSDTCLHGEKVAYKERELRLQLWRDKKRKEIRSYV